MLSKYLFNESGKRFDALCMFQAKAIMLSQRPRRRDDHGTLKKKDGKKGTLYTEVLTEELNKAWLCSTE